jgi:hypothetical protein
MYVESEVALKKNGQLKARQPTPHKDQSTAFYQAQLEHYGLKPLKTKAAAKHALLVASKGDKKGLRVPDAILKLEKGMAALFERKNRLAIEEKNLAGQESNNVGKVNAKAGKKRKREVDEQTTGLAEDKGPAKKKAIVGKVW